jgi:hypothetical protein
VGGAAAFLQVTGSQGKGAQAVPSPAHGNPLSAVRCPLPTRPCPAPVAST